MASGSCSENFVEVRLKEIVDKFFATIHGGGFYESLFSKVLKSVILPPNLKNSTIRSSTFALAEVQINVKFSYSRDPEWRTFLIFYDAPLDSVPGVLKISGKLSCELKEFVRSHFIPIPDNGLNASEYIRSFKPILMSKFPGIGAVHTRVDEDFHEEINDRNWLMWNVEEEKLASIEPPAQRPEKSESESSEPAPPLERPCPYLEMLIDEHYNPESRLSKLPIEIIETVYSHVVNFWKEHIETGGIYASVVAKVEFPPPTGINVNMMPIRLCDRESIPDNMKQYLPLLAACPINRDEFSGIGYLTIHESMIEEDGKSQRRGGVHTETPGKIWLESYQDPSLDQGVEGSWSMQIDSPLTVAWGRGLYDSDLGTFYEYIGGLYMASNVSDSCRVWNCKVTNPEEIVGPLGDLEHMASYLGEGETLQAGEMVWMTDCTPHESLPLKRGTYRQYFRLVTSQVSVWYADHSTPNPLGITPPDRVTIVHGNKFGLTQEQYPHIQSNSNQESEPKMRKR